MEKSKINYQNGKIYTIRSYQTDDVYYGSTTQPLSKRLSTHKRLYKLWLNKKHNYVTSFEIVKYDDCYIELYENCPCNSKSELEKREGEYIRNNKCVNKYIPCRSKKQYREDNKDNIKQKHNCSCGGKYTYSHKAKHFRTKKHTTFMDRIRKE